jgi:hypothetical protein
MFVSMDVTFRESEPFYGESTDLSLLFTELDQRHSVEDGHEGEKVVSHPQQGQLILWALILIMGFRFSR